MEAEAMLLGIWSNFEELEEQVTIEELKLILKAGYDREFRKHRMNAALKGIKLDEPEVDDETTSNETVEERFQRIQKKAEAILAGKSEAELKEEEVAAEYMEMGFEIKKE